MCLFSLKVSSLVIKINAKHNEISNGLIQFFKDSKLKLLNTKILDLNEISAGWETELYSFEMRYSENDGIVFSLIALMFGSAVF